MKYHFLNITFKDKNSQNVTGHKTAIKCVDISHKRYNFKQ